MVTRGLTSQYVGKVEMTAAAIRRQLCWMRLCGPKSRFKDDRRWHGPSRPVSPVSEFETTNHNGPFVPQAETIVTSTRSPENSNQVALEGMRNRLKPIVGPQFLIYVVKMIPKRLWTDTKRLGNSRGGGTDRKHPEDFKLLRG